MGFIELPPNNGMERTGYAAGYIPVKGIAQPLIPEPLGRFTFQDLSMIRLTILLASSALILCACTPGGAIDATGFPINTEQPPTVQVTKQHTPSPTSRSTPTSSPSPTLTPDVLRTPVPPLTSHEWVPESILVELEAVGSGDGCCIYSLPPWFILYADGTLILRDNSDIAKIEKLDRQGICAFLNTVDQFGFFDYDPSTYGISPMPFPSRSRILVNAWRKQDFILQDLFDFVFGLLEPHSEYGIEEPPLILPALRDTYTFLRNYQSEGLVPFESESQIVWIYEPWYGVDSYDVSKWPLETPYLVELFQQTKCGESYQPIVLEGDVLDEWRRRITNGLYSEDGFIAEVYSRPVWPGEIPPGCGMAYSALFPIELPDPTQSMICNPEDGVISYSP